MFAERACALRRLQRKDILLYCYSFYACVNELVQKESVVFKKENLIPTRHSPWRLTVLFENFHLIMERCAFQVINATLYLTTFISVLPYHIFTNSKPPASASALVAVKLFTPFPCRSEVCI